MSQFGYRTGAIIWHNGADRCSGAEIRRLAAIADVQLHEWLRRGHLASIRRGRIEIAPYGPHHRVDRREQRQKEGLR